MAQTGDEYFWCRYNFIARTTGTDYLVRFKDGFGLIRSDSKPVFKGGKD